MNDSLVILNVRIEPALKEQIDEYRFANRMKSESEAIRQLLFDGLPTASQQTIHRARRAKREGKA